MTMRDPVLIVGAKMASPEFLTIISDCVLRSLSGTSKTRSSKSGLFGLTSNEGNHGEDVKEYYFFIDNMLTHAYMKFLYKYPQQAFPYTQLVEENCRRSKQEPEFELLDTGVFAEDCYFDVFVEYAKASAEDILIQITIANRGS